jgi:6-phosphogluconate dehydrogenase
LALIRAASDHYGWSVNLAELARIWKGGCIIRAALLDDIRRVYGDQPALPNLLLAGGLRQRLLQGQTRWRRLVALGQEQGLPLPAMSASLAYYDGVRAGWLPHNLTQAQRDAFGAHTYQRNDEPDAPFVHSDWLK